MVTNIAYTDVLATAAYGDGDCDDNCLYRRVLWR